MNKLEYYASKIPDHLIVGKCLWCDHVRIEINHIDNDLNKQLDYEDAFRRMYSKLAKRW